MAADREDHPRAGADHDDDERRCPVEGARPPHRGAGEDPHDREDAHLVVIGTLREGSAVDRAIARFGVRQHVAFVGGESDEEIVERYAHASVAVVPSLYEGFSLPAIEAMACGVPLVVTSTGALPEVAGEASLVVDPADSERSAGAIAKVLGDGDLAERSGRSRFAPRTRAFFLGPRRSGDSLAKCRLVIDRRRADDRSRCGPRWRAAPASSTSVAGRTATARRPLFAAATSSRSTRAAPEVAAVVAK